MNNRFLVLPFNEKLLRRLRGHSVVIKIDDPARIPQVAQAAERFGNHIHCILVQSSVSISSIHFRRDWESFPIALYAPELGSFSTFAKSLPIATSMNLRVYLALDSPDNFAAIRILSSLGIETAIQFTKAPINWDWMADLMAYAFFGLAPHAPIAPYNYIADRYNAQNIMDFNTIYFNDPRTYLHMDHSGRIALTPEDCAAEIYALKDIKELETVEKTSAYQTHINAWRHFFLKPDGCAYCESWRICLGKFSVNGSQSPECKGFFTELMNTIEQLKNSQKKEEKTWQP